MTRDFLLKEGPSAIINIVDATNLERNLYLSLQLMELETPMVMALNMMDEVRASGNSINVKKLSEHRGIPVVPISAGKNEGISDLLEAVIKTVREQSPPKKSDFCTGEVHKAIHSIAHIIEDHAGAEMGIIDRVNGLRKQSRRGPSFGEPLSFLFTALLYERIFKKNHTIYE